MRAIYDVGGELAFAVTLPDEAARNKSGRVYIDEFAASKKIPLFKFRNINEPAARSLVSEMQPDWLFIIGWSQIAGPELLALPRLGAVGIHPTLLPEGRGRASIPWAIIKGLARTGVTMFALDEGVDTGDILAQSTLPVDPSETATSLYGKISLMHETIIKETWPKLVDGSLPRQPQDHARATYWPGRKPADGELLGSMPVGHVDRLVRATTRPYPGAFYRLPGKEVLRVWQGAIASNGASKTGSIRLDFADGQYDALEYAIEN
jgi:methionyl-tRNA formyltransferase